MEGFAHEGEEVFLEGDPFLVVRALRGERVAGRCEDEFGRAAEILGFERFGETVAVVVNGNAEPEEVAVAGGLRVAILHGEEDLELGGVRVGRVVGLVEVAGMEEPGFDMEFGFREIGKLRRVIEFLFHQEVNPRIFDGARARTVFDEAVGGHGELAAGSEGDAFC